MKKEYKLYKVLELPEELLPDSIYYVSVGDKFEQVVTDNEGNPVYSIYITEQDIPTELSEFNNDVGFITGLSWEELTGKPSTFTPSSHTHTKSDIVDFEHTHNWLDILGVPTFDNYQSWNLKSNGIQRTTVQSGGTLDLVEGSHMDISYGAGGVMTFNVTPFSWSEITGKPTEFNPTAHTHNYSELLGLPFIPTLTSDLTNDAGFITINDVPANTHISNGLWDENLGRITLRGEGISNIDIDIDGRYSLLGHIHSWGEIVDKPTSFTPSEHTHNYSELTGLPSIPTLVSELTNDIGFITLEDVPENTNNYISNGLWDSTTGIITLKGSGIPNVPIDIDGRYSLLNHEHAWTEITGKPSTFTPSAHSHSWEEITGKPTLDNYEKWFVGVGDDSYFHVTRHNVVNFIGDGNTTVTRNNNEIIISSESGANNYISNSTWDSTTGIITLKGAGIPNVPIDIDGRYSLLGHTHAWEDITGKPLTFTPSSHTHSWTEITEKPDVDNYDRWYVGVGDSSYFGVTRHNVVNFTGGGGTTVTREGNEININSELGANNYISNGLWDTTTGIITLRGGGIPNVDIDIDGRYSLIGHTHDYDKYDYWRVRAGDGTYTNVGSGGALTFAGGAGINVSREGGILTISNTAPDTNNYISNGLFETTSGIITLKGADIPNVEIDIDGRYSLLGHNHDSQYDNYNHWKVRAEDGAYTNVGSAGAITFAGGTGIGVTREGGVITINNTAPDTNNYHSNALWDTTTGIITIKGEGVPNIPIDIDGRYSLIGHTHSEYDNYGAWRVTANGDGFTEISSYETLNFVGNGNTSVSRDGNDIIISSEGGEYDNYNHWKVRAGDGAYTSVGSAGAITFDGGEGIDVSRVGGVITINNTAPDTNNYHSNATWDTTTGIITIKGAGVPNIPVDIDGRYSLIGHTHSEYDNYDFWRVRAGDGSYTNVGSGGAITFAGGTGIDVTRDGGIITIANTGGGGTDTYGAWRVTANGGAFTEISSYETLNFVGSGATTVTRDGNDIIISSTSSGSGGTWNGGSVTNDITIQKNAAKLTLMADSVNQANGGEIFLAESSSNGGYVKYNADSNQFKIGMKSSGTDIDSMVINRDSADVTFLGNVTAQKIYQDSLRSLKKNIESYQKDALSLVDSLDIVEFDYKKGEGNNIGIIADDTAPEFLSNEGNAVNLYNTIFIQAKAIQELKSKVESQEERIDRLERLVEKLNK